MMYDQRSEAMERGDLEQLQIERLQATLNRAYRNVAFTKKQFDDAGINIESVRSLTDLANLPFTTKDDLRRSYPYDAFAVPLRDIVRIHSTSGTTGKPIVVGYTKNDIEIWSTLTARVLTAAGLSSSDFVQIAFRYGLFTGGFGFHYGAEKIGASVIPASGEDIHKQIDIMKDYKTTALISTPGYALHMAAILDEVGMHPGELFLAVGLFGSEPWSENLRGEIERRLQIKAYDNYGLSEIIGPGVAFECEHRNGLHVNEDHFIVEVIDTDTCQPVEPGVSGELVFTTITKQGFPLIRYRTGDISALMPDTCACGRTLMRIDRISGRTDDMIIVEGTNLFPSRIEQILFDLEGVEPHFQIVLERKDGVDSVEIRVEVSEKMQDFDEIRTLQGFSESVAAHILSETSLEAKITLVEPKSIERSTGGKMKRVVDRRTL